MKNLEKGSQDGMENKIPYYDITEDTRKGYPLIINIGGRQIGKTYSTFKYIMDNDLSFVYLRRKDKHLKKCCTVKGNPFKPNNEDTGQQSYGDDIRGAVSAARARTGQDLQRRAGQRKQDIRRIVV